jgi:hypothetical protein
MRIFLLALPGGLIACCSQAAQYESYLWAIVAKDP